MSGDSDRALIASVLQRLASIEPRWTLTGGGALVHVHLHHRSTKDLDLFWHGIRELGPIPAEVERRLAASGLEVTTEERSPGFVRFRVTNGPAVVVVDLVATAATVVDAPTETMVEGVAILVDTPQEILTNKLTALLSRSELRDVVDIRALMASGADLDRALSDAPKKDAGFSPAVLAWVLETFPLVAIARREGYDAAAIEALEAFRGELVDRLARAAAPE